MPFVITTKRRGEPSPLFRGGKLIVVSRRAVATLEEVGDAARDVMFAVKGIGARARLLVEMDAWDNRSTLTLTLPDGTVIEVESVTWEALIDAADLPRDLVPANVALDPTYHEAQRAMARHEIIDAYNAAQ